MECLTPPTPFSWHLSWRAPGMMEAVLTRSTCKVVTTVYHAWRLVTVLWEGHGRPVLWQLTTCHRISPGNTWAGFFLWLPHPFQSSPESTAFNPQHRNLCFLGPIYNSNLPLKPPQRCLLSHSLALSTTAQETLQALRKGVKNEHQQQFFREDENLVFCDQWA